MNSNIDVPLDCFVCGRPSDFFAEMLGGITMPACNGCMLKDDAPCSRCGHTVFDHVGVHGPGLPEQAMFTDCDITDCTCQTFRR